MNQPLADLAAQYRRALLQRETASATTLLQAYGRAWTRIRTLAEALGAEIDAQRAAGKTVTAGMIRRNTRYRALLRQLDDEMRRLLPYTEEMIRQGQAGAIEAALDEAAALTEAGLPGYPETRQALMTAWNRLPTEAAEALVGVLQDGSPLAKLLAELGPATAQGIGDTLVNGLAMGWNPQRVARELRDAYGLTMTRALRISRTEMLRAYRTAHILSYRENPQIVKGWQWSASKSLRTCIACIMNDGKRFTLEQFFPMHVNCRCSPVPVTVSWRELGLDVPETAPAQTGREWFEGLPPDDQRTILGPGVYDAWRAGQIQPEHFWHVEHNETWGDAYVASSLKHALQASTDERD